MYDGITTITGIETMGPVLRTIDAIEKDIDNLMERTTEALKELRELSDKLKEMETSTDHVEDYIATEMRSMEKDRFDLINVRATLKDSYRQYPEDVPSKKNLDEVAMYYHKILPSEVKTLEDYLNDVKHRSELEDRYSYLVVNWFNGEEDSMAYSEYATYRLGEVRENLLHEALNQCIMLGPSLSMEARQAIITGAIQPCLEKASAIQDYIDEVHSSKVYSLDQAKIAHDHYTDARDFLYDLRDNEREYRPPTAEDVSKPIADLFGIEEWVDVPWWDYLPRLIDTLQRVVKEPSHRWEDHKDLLYAIGGIYARLIMHMQFHEIGNAPLEAFDQTVTKIFGVTT